MTSIEVGIIGTILMIVLMLLEVPVWVSISAVGIVGFAVLDSLSHSLNLLAILPTSQIRDYTVAIFPLFLLMGELADISGMMKKAYDAASSLLGNLPGGLAMASVIGSAAFSSISGSSMTCAALMGRIALPQLLDHKYDPKLSVGALCAGGTLGNLIPPGILLCFYAVIANVSLGRLFAACFLPGILLTLMYCGQIYISCVRNPKLGPRAETTSLKQKGVSTINTLPIVIVFGVVMGGIWSGIFTASEAAAIGVVLVLIYALIMKTLHKKDLIQAFTNTLSITGMAFAILIGARIFTSFLSTTGLAELAATWVTGLNTAPVMIVIIMMVIYFILGIAMDVLTMLLLTTPIFIAILSALNVDLVWFGVLVIIQMELSNISPPVGMNLYVIAGMAKDKGISMGTVFSGVLPFCLTMLVFNLIIIFFPEITQWLPNILMK